MEGVPLIMKHMGPSAEAVNDEPDTLEIVIIYKWEMQALVFTRC